MNTNDTKSMVIYQHGFSLFMALDTSNINVTQVGGCDFIKEYEEYKYDSLSKHHLSIFVQHCKCLFIYFAWDFDGSSAQRSIGIYSTQVFNNIITCLTSLIVMDIIRITEFCEIWNTWFY